MIEQKFKLIEVDVEISRWNKTDQYQLYHKVLQWIGYQEHKVEELYFKTEQLSIQSGVKKYREKEKSSTMKQISSLAIKQLL